MDWKKVGTGAVIGGILGGPVGAGIGMMIGAMFKTDSIPCPHCGQKVKISPENPIYTCPNCGKLFTTDSGLHFLIVLGLLAKIAQVDGYISRAEAEEILSIFIDIFEIDPSQLNEIQETFQKAKESDLSVIQFAQLLYSIEQERKILEGIFALLFRIGAADGGLEPEEERALRQIQKEWYLGERIFEELSNIYLKEYREIEEAFKLFGCNRTSSFREVRQIYRQKIRNLHPDRYQNLPKEAREVLEREAQRLNNAYEVLKRFYREN